MDIDALKTFLEVSRCRHFGQAARNLFISQSTVSVRIKLLEDRVGAPLFVRKRNNIQLTATGEKLLKYAETIVTTWSRARQEIAIEDINLVPFVVGSQPSLWDSVLVDWLSYMHTALPELAINAELHSMEALSRRVQDGTMDLAFLFDDPGALDYECEEVTRVPFVMVSTSPDLTRDTAVHTDYVLVDWGSSFALSHARYFPDMPPPHMRIMPGRVALDFILANGGTAYMAEPLVRQLLADDRLYLVKDAPVIQRAVFAIYPRAGERKDLVSCACDYFNGQDGAGMQSGIA